jgi:hypothetical protein
LILDASNDGGGGSTDLDGDAAAIAAQLEVEKKGREELKRRARKGEKAARK